jgi:hypothetical protein
MTHHRKKHNSKRRTRTTRTARTSRRTRKHSSRKAMRKYRGRGGVSGSINFADYQPVGTINPSVMVPQDYIPFNPNVSAIPYPLSTTNFPLP